MELVLPSDITISKIGPYYQSVKDSIVKEKEIIINTARVENFDSSSIQLLLFLKEESLRGRKKVKFEPEIKKEILNLIRELGIEDF